VQQAGASELAKEVEEFLAEHKLESAAAALPLLGVETLPDLSGLSFLDDQVPPR
jgi:hypothetical protein